MRLRMKNFISIDIEKMDAEIYGDVVVSFVYGGNEENSVKLPQELINKLKKDTVIYFTNDDAVKLSEKRLYITVRDDPENYIITYTIRKKF